MEVIVLNDIIFLKQPKIVNIKQWLAENNGYVGVGKRLETLSDVQLLAYQKADYASEEMKQYAKKTGCLTLVSVSDGGLNAID